MGERTHRHPQPEHWEQSQGFAFCLAIFIKKKGLKGSLNPGCHLPWPQGGMDQQL